MSSVVTRPDEPRRVAVCMALAAIRIYQVFCSQLFAGSCRFVPSCSAYAHEAIERHGALGGSWLALKRLARCHPLGRHGLDPVPEPGGPNLQGRA